MKQICYCRNVSGQARRLNFARVHKALHRPSACQDLQITCKLPSTSQQRIRHFPEVAGEQHSHLAKQGALSHDKRLSLYKSTPVIHDSC